MEAETVAARDSARRRASATSSGVSFCRRIPVARDRQAPSNRATISREPHALKPKLDWIHSVIAKAVLSLALTAVWKLSYAMKDGLLPIVGEKSGLGVG